MRRPCARDPAGARPQLLCGRQAGRSGGSTQIRVVAGARHVCDERDRSAVGEDPRRAAVEVGPALVRVAGDETRPPHRRLRCKGITAHELDLTAAGLLRPALQNGGHAADDDDRRARLGQPAESAKRVVHCRGRQQTLQPLGRSQRELIGDELVEAGVLLGEVDDQFEIASSDERVQARQRRLSRAGLPARDRLARMSASVGELLLCDAGSLPGDADDVAASHPMHSVANAVH